MVVYIAGKMNGLPDKGRKAFEEAETELKAMGFTVLNPACLPDGLPGDRYMPTCLTMVDTADILVLLPGWIYSPGAMLERAFAEYQGKMVFELFGLEKCMDEWQSLLASTWKRTHGDYPCQTFPGFLRNHCTVVEAPMVNIGYVEQLKKQIKNQAAIIKQREAEQEALISDFREYDELPCALCQHYDKSPADIPCRFCKTLDPNDRDKDSKWQWRGLKEE